MQPLKLTDAELTHVFEAARPIPVDAPVMRTVGVSVMALSFRCLRAILMMVILIKDKYDDHHDNVNGRGGLE